MNTQKIISTSIENDKQQLINIRQCSEPDDYVKKIISILKYKIIPIKKTKFVGCQNQAFEKIDSDKQAVNSPQLQCWLRDFTPSRL